MSKPKKGAKVKAQLKLEIEAGKATPAPPIGPALGQHGVNISDFVNQYNEKTRNKMGDIIPCVLTVYEDRSFTIELKSPPTASLIAKASGIEKGSATPNTEKVGTVSRKELRKIAEIKMDDLNTKNPDSALKIIEGTAKSMGLDITD